MMWHFYNSNEEDGYKGHFTHETNSLVTIAF